ncbi:MAG: FecR domain-containing protein [Pseudomonadota bacterium]
MIKVPDIARDRREAQAAEWAGRRLGGRPTAREEAEFSTWMRDRENAEAFAAYERASRALDHAESDLLAEALFEDLQEFADRRPGAGRAPWRVIAAAVAAAFCAGVLALQFALQDAAPEAYATDIGERRNIVLADGSAVTINTATAVEVAYTRKERAVVLNNGEAFFRVERNRNRPFTVATPYGDVVVVGTAFSVRSTPSGAAVAVLEGTVRVAGEQGGAVTLGAGEGVSLSVDGAPGAVEAVDPAAEFAWRRGVARFGGEPLAAVVAELNRYFDPPILLNDPSLGAYPVSGEFDLTDRDTAVAGLAIAFGLEVRETTSGVVLQEPDAPGDTEEK